MTNPYNIQNISGNEIGDPVPTFSNKLSEGWIWLEGAEVSKIAYGKLYEIYGDDYGLSLNPENFVLPDCRDKTPWGSPDGNFGYLEPTLPNINGSVYVFGNGGPHGVGTFGNPSGCIGLEGSNNIIGHYTATANQLSYSTVIINAHNSNPIYQDDATVRTPSFKVRWKTRYK